MKWILDLQFLQKVGFFLFMLAPHVKMQALFPIRNVIKMLKRYRIESFHDGLQAPLTKQVSNLVTVGNALQSLQTPGLDQALRNMRSIC